VTRAESEMRVALVILEMRGKIASVTLGILDTRGKSEMSHPRHPRDEREREMVVVMDIVRIGRTTLLLRLS